MSGAHRPQIRIRRDPPSQLNVYVEIEPSLLVNTRDRVHLILLQSIPRLRRPLALWLSLIAMALTLGFNLLSGDVPRLGPIGPQHLPYYRTILALGLIVILAYLLFLYRRRRSSLTIDDIIDAIEAESRTVDQWQPAVSDHRQEPVLRGPWHYDFIDHFPEATAARHAGSDITVMPRAVCEGVARRAIFEHPPEDLGFYSELTYAVTPPAGASPLELRGYLGILSELADTAPPRASHRGAANAVRFEVTVNDELSFHTDKDTSEWEPFSIHMPEDPTLAICFRTNCLGQPQCNWAAWAEPELVAGSPA